MGTFQHTIEVGDPDGTRFEPIEILVDTRASYTILPASMLEHLNVTAHDKISFILPDGRFIDREIGQTWVQINSKSIITIVVFGVDESQSVLGAYTLEGLRLAVDPVNERLIPVPGLLMAYPEITKKVSVS